MRRRVMVLVGVVATAVALSGLGEIRKADAAQIQTRVPRHRVLYAGHSKGIARPALVEPAVTVGPRTAAIQVTYHGFSAQARTAFQAAVDYWAGTITSKVPIAIDATWESLPANVLGSAGPTTTLNNFANQPIANTFYPIGLANSIAGKDLVPSQPDISASFNSANASWYFGIDGRPPVGRYDLRSVVLHEIGHGLGLNDTMSYNPTTGVGARSNPPNIYDRFVRSSAGARLVDMANNTKALGTQLVSGQLYFAGPRVTFARSARLYAPKPFEDGSSVAHLDELKYPPGNPEALMTPILSDGEAEPTAGPLTLDMLRDLGWTVNYQTSKLVSVTQAAGESSLYRTDANGNVFTNYFATGIGRWTGWQPLLPGRQLRGSITAVADGLGAVDLFAVALDGIVWHGRHMPKALSSWTGWSTGSDVRPFAIGTKLTAVNTGPGAVRVFASAPDGRVWTQSQTVGSPWTNWSALPGNVAFPLAATFSALSARPGEASVYGVANDGKVYTAYLLNGASAWQGWFSLGAPAGVLGVKSVTPGTGIGVVSARPGESSLYLLDWKGQAWTNYFLAGGSSWSGWKALGAHLFPANTLTAISTVPGGTSLFTMGSDGQVWSQYFRPGASSWSGWFGLGNGSFPLAQRVGAYSNNPNATSLFVIGGDGAVWSQYFRPGGAWSGWYAL